jgi:hypothetical protein
LGRKSGIERVTAPIALITGRVPKVGRAWNDGWPSKDNDKSVPDAPRARLYVMIEDALYVVVVFHDRDLVLSRSIVVGPDML